MPGNPRGLRFLESTRCYHYASLEVMGHIQITAQCSGHRLQMVGLFADYLMRCAWACGVFG